ncbi:MAG: hypothetical protein HYU66_27160 [Armatimonadetes bacterium]|nr:hypothetical protein [Armatimonadota bacterium]
MLQKYAARLALLRRPGAAKVLVVMVDADNLAVRERLEQLAEALRAGGVAPRGADEPAALLVPKRNIQTWIEHLRTAPPTPVQEDEPYPEFESTGRREYWAPAVDQLVVLLVPGSPWPECPPSLSAALPEFARIP